MPVELVFCQPSALSDSHKHDSARNGEWLVCMATDGGHPLLQGRPHIGLKGDRGGWNRALKWNRVVSRAGRKADLAQEGVRFCG